MLINPVRWDREMVFVSRIRSYSSSNVFVVWHNVNVSSNVSICRGHLYDTVPSWLSDVEPLRPETSPPCLGLLMLTPTLETWSVAKSVISFRMPSGSVPAPVLKIDLLMTNVFKYIPIVRSKSSIACHP